MDQKGTQKVHKYTKGTQIYKKYQKGTQMSQKITYLNFLANIQIFT